MRTHTKRTLRRGSKVPFLFGTLVVSSEPTEYNQGPYGPERRPSACRYDSCIEDSSIRLLTLLGYLKDGETTTAQKNVIAVAEERKEFLLSLHPNYTFNADI